MQVGEGQRQRDHHQAGERVERLASRTGSRGAARSARCRRGGGCSEQLERRHRVRPAAPRPPPSRLVSVLGQSQRGHALRRDAAPRRRCRVSYSRAARRPISVQRAVVDDARLRGGDAATPAGRRRRTRRCGRPAAAPSRASDADVDRVAALAVRRACVSFSQAPVRPSFECRPGSAPSAAAPCALAEPARRSRRRRRSARAKHQAQQRQQCTARARARGRRCAGSCTRDALRQPRQRVDGADQHRDRQQLVEVARQLSSSDVASACVQRGVAALADVAAARRRSR